MSARYEMALENMIGKDIGGCRIERKLGQGGMGAVFLATQLSLERPVAVKILPNFLASESQEAVDRFMREARLAAQLNHPNVVQIIEVGKDQNLYFMVMEYVDGPTLHRLIREKSRLDEKAALRTIMQIAMGLASAEKINLVHRDIKPANILINRNGIAKLADFGLVKDQGSDTVGLTHSGQIMGTPSFMSPEQANGEKVDSRSDMYSLGATLYNALTGEPPYKGENPIAILVRHLSDPIPDPCDVNPGLSRACRSLVFRLMAKDRENRFSSFRELVPSIRKAMQGREIPILEKKTPELTGGAHRDFRTLERPRLLKGGRDADVTPPTGAPPDRPHGRRPSARLQTASRRAPGFAVPFWQTPMALAGLSAVTLIIVAVALALAFSIPGKNKTTPADEDSSRVSPRPTDQEPARIDSVPPPSGQTPPDLAPVPFAISWISPADGSVLSSENVTLTWKVEGDAPPGCKVTLMGDTLSPDEIRPGLRTRTIVLTEGIHDVALAVARSGAEPEVQAVSLRIDITRPVILLDDVKGKEITVTSGSFALTGRVLDENLRRITVNGEEVKPAGAGFTTVLKLAKGPNRIAVAAWDRAGHKSETVFTVHFDSSVPETVEPGERKDEYRNQVDLATLIRVPDGKHVIAGGVRITLDSFLIARHEVTNAMFAAFLDAHKKVSDEAGMKYFSHEEWETPGFAQDGRGWAARPGSDDLPAANVTWHGAAAYAKWAGGRLPTEAEWEVAASFSASGTPRKYPWGDFEPVRESCNFGNLRRAPAPVGSIPGDRSELGVMDMGGNLMEWCLDAYHEDYAGKLMSSPDPASPGLEKAPGKRSARGGSFWHPASACKCSSRAGFDPAFATRTLGFRYVIETRK